MLWELNFVGVSVTCVCETCTLSIKIWFRLFDTELELLSMVPSTVIYSLMAVPFVKGCTWKQ